MLLFQLLVSPLECTDHPIPAFYISVCDFFIPCHLSQVNPKVIQLSPLELKQNLPYIKQLLHSGAILLASELMFTFACPVAKVCFHSIAFLLNRNGC